MTPAEMTQRTAEAVACEWLLASARASFNVPPEPKFADSLP